jgi:hypothetical protein
MTEQARKLVEKQIGRVRRRLFLQVVFESLVVCMAIGLFTAMLWFLVRPLAFSDAGEAVRWSVAGGLLALSAIGALLVAWKRRPMRIDSSLALDERFGLRERVTTFLTLSDDQLETPAGQALLKDVQAHLSNLQLAGAFPLTVSPRRLLLPAGALVLAIVACLLDPFLADINFGSIASAEPPRRQIDAAKIRDGLDQLKKNAAQRNKEDTVKSEELKKMEQEFEKLLNQPLDGKNEEKIKERAEQFRKLEEKMKERLEGIREKAEKIDAFKKQLEKLGLDPEKLIKDGPGKEFQDALAKGDLEKAKLALEKLAKDMKNNKLDEKQIKQLAEQFKNLQEQLKKVMNDDQFKKKLEQDLKDGKIKKEDFDREMQNFKQLKELTDVVGQTKEFLGNGNAKEAGEKLDQMMKRFEEIELTEAEIRDLLRDQAEVRNALNLLEDALEGDDEEGGEGGGRPGRKRRANPNDPDGKVTDERSRAHADLKGARVTGYARGGNFNRIPAQSVGGAFKQAAQEAPEALDRQRIPDDARPIFSGYFDRLGNQK